MSVCRKHNQSDRRYLGIIHSAYIEAAYTCILPRASMTGAQQLAMQLASMPTHRGAPSLSASRC